MQRHLEGSDLFVTSVRVEQNDQVKVFIDGDRGVLIEDCVKLSRVLESRLNETGVNFSLDVSSHGASSPLLIPRQYRKHLGREFHVKFNDGSQASGVLQHSDENKIVLEYEVREPKPLGKGKVTVQKQIEIPYQHIKESKIKLKF